jgi:hypothetical protein
VGSGCADFIKRKGVPVVRDFVSYPGEIWVFGRFARVTMRSKPFLEVPSIFVTGLKPLRPKSLEERAACTASNEPLKVFDGRDVEMKVRWEGSLNVTHQFAKYGIAPIDIVIRDNKVFHVANVAKVRQFQRFAEVQRLELE